MKKIFASPATSLLGLICVVFGIMIAGCGCPECPECPPAQESCCSYDSSVGIYQMPFATADSYYGNFSAASPDSVWGFTMNRQKLCNVLCKLGDHVVIKYGMDSYGNVYAMFNQNDDTTTYAINLGGGSSPGDVDIDTTGGGPKCPPNCQ